jgi:hypothetical protein
LAEIFFSNYSLNLKRILVEDNFNPFVAARTPRTILITFVQDLIISPPLPEFTSKTFCQHYIAWDTSHTHYFFFFPSPGPAWISVVGAAAKFLAKSEIRYCKTSKLQQKRTFCQLFFNIFLHKGLNVVSPQKIFRNYFILVENFECVFTTSIQGRAACVSSEQMEQCRLTLEPWRLTLELWSSPWSSGGSPCSHGGSPWISGGSL